MCVCVCVCVCVWQLATGTGDAARACETDGLHKSRVCVSDPDFLVCSDPIWAAGEWGSLPPSLPPSLVSLTHFSGMDLTNSCRPHSHPHPAPSRCALIIPHIREDDVVIHLSRGMLDFLRGSDWHSPSDFMMLIQIRSIKKALGNLNYYASMPMGESVG